MRGPTIHNRCSSLKCFSPLLHVFFFLFFEEFSHSLSSPTFFILSPGCAQELRPATVSDSSSPFHHTISIWPFRRMETRGRGREARASSDENRPLASTNQDPSTAAPQTATSRPRSRRNSTGPSQSQPRVTRSRRASRVSSSSATATRRASLPAANITNNTQPPPSAPERPRRGQASRRSSAAAVPPAPTVEQTSRGSRKRTRSSRRNSEPAQDSLESGPLVGSSSVGAGPSTSATPSNNPRPSKRSRRNPASTRNLRSATTPSSSTPTNGSGSSIRPVRGMNSGSGDGQRSQEANAQRREEGSNSLGGDRAGPTTLQGLLRRLGADISDIFPGNSGSSHARLQQLRSMIIGPESPEEQLEALTELSEFLSVGTEESIVSHSVNLFVSPLVNLLRTGPNVEIKIYAARALTHMMEALPSSSSAIAINGAAGPLCQNLLAIEYIDLAEQSLSALHKLSADYPHQIVSANGFQAVLSFIDFFPVGVQRVAAATACNLCRSPRADAMDMISSVLPIMMRLLGSDDQRIRESALLGFTRLAEAFRTSADKLEILSGAENALIEEVFGLIVPPSPPALSPQSHSCALRLLSLLARGSAKLALRILSTEALIQKLKQRIDEGSSVLATDCLNLADCLLPEMLDIDVAFSQAPRTRRPRRGSASAISNTAVDSKRREDLERNMNLLQYFGETLFESLMKFYISSADAQARRTALSVMSKFIANSSNEALGEVLGRKAEHMSEQTVSSVGFCPFVAALLGENGSSHEAITGLAMAASTLMKLPLLREPFLREGVVHEIMRIAHQCNDENDDGETDHAVSRSGPDGSVGLSEADSAGPVVEQLLLALDTRNPDLLWSAVYSVQRGSAFRSSRGDGFPSASRPPARALLEIRMSSQQALPFLLPRISKSILKNYLGASSDGALNEDLFKNTSLGQLTNICDRLDSVKSSRDDVNCIKAFESLIDLLLSQERVTVFEISRSGAMASLSNFFSQPTDSVGSSRIAAFVRCLSQDGSGSAFSSLVKLALGVLGSEEKLPLHISDSNSSSVGSGLRQLTQPFKLRLKKASVEEGGGGLRDYAHHVVLIEPLAIMASVQDFLWPRVREPDSHAGGSSSGPARRRSSRGERGDSDVAILPENESGSADFGEGNDNEGDDLGEDRLAVEEMFDMEDEIADDAGADDDDDHHSGGSDEEVSSGDEDMIEHDAVDSDDNDNDGPDSMDVDHLARSIPPLELDHDALGLAPSRNGAAGNGRDGPETRSNTDAGRHDLAFRSYAAALAANIQRASGYAGPSRFEGRAAITPDRDDGRGRREPSSPKLSFSLNGRKLAHGCSILSGVIQSANDDHRISHKIWSDVHMLVYAKAEETQPAASRSSGHVAGSSGDNLGKHSAGSTDVSTPLRRSQRLQENRDRGGDTGPITPVKITLESTKAMKPSVEVLERISTRREVIPVLRSSPSLNLPKEICAVVDVLRRLHWIYQGSKSQHGVLEGTGFPFSKLVLPSDIQFVSHKLSAKMVRQLSDPLALSGGTTPGWCFELSRNASFLIPFEVRRILFQSSTLGVSRALQLLQTRHDMSGVGGSSHRQPRAHREEARVSRLHRQKVRVHRQRILESAIKVMNFYSTHNTVLEVQYFDEAGTGLGPTLEFYTMASRELQRIDLRLWRGSSDKLSKQREFGGSVSAAFRINNALMSNIRSGKRRSRRHSSSSSGNITGSSKSDDEPPAFVVPTGNGLYPSCLPLLPTETEKESAETTKALFGFVGRLLGKALVDGRLLDLRFSEVFSRLVLAYCRVIFDNLRSTLGPSVDSGHCENTFYSIDDELDTVDRDEVWNLFTSEVSAMQLLEVVDSQLASSLKLIVEMLEKRESDLVSSLCLTFVLPGDDKIELVKGGSEIEVTAQNGDDFVRRVLYHVLFGGVCQQVEALLRGLGDVIDVTKLLMFQSNELELLACGPSFENWTVPFLIESTRCDHGYSHESTAVSYLLQILSELDEADQQRFVLFTTGSSALPLGGLRNLHPKLTIVRRTPEAGRSPDECLPTVMTCTNYFKLPDYTSYEVAKKQIMYAVREGQRSFHLS